MNYQILDNYSFQKMVIRGRPVAHQFSKKTCFLNIAIFEKNTIFRLYYRPYIVRHGCPTGMRLCFNTQLDKQKKRTPVGLGRACCGIGIQIQDIQMQIVYCNIQVGIVHFKIANFNTLVAWHIFQFQNISIFLNFLVLFYQALGRKIV